MSAQRLSAFYLRYFCSVANLNLKCLGWHVCLELLFDKNRLYENAWDWVSENILFAKNSIKKGVFKEKPPTSFVPASSSGLFLLYPFF